METKYLKDIGLSDGEISIYMELLKEECCTASELAKRAGINRTLSYQMLDRLTAKGIAGYVIKSNTKYFKAANPAKILDFLKEREDNIRKILPMLSSMKAPSKAKYSVELYEGKEGLKTVFQDVLRSGAKEFLDMTSGMTVNVLPRFWMDQWNMKRVKNIPKSRFLCNQTPAGTRRAKELAACRKTRVRLFPKGLQSPSHIYIYADRVGITLWEKEDPFAIMIKSREISARFAESFEWFWKIGEPVPKANRKGSR